MLTIVALGIGVAALTFGAGAAVSAKNQGADKAQLGPVYDVGVERFGAYPDSRVMATLSSLPQVSSVVSVRRTMATIPDVKDPTTVTVTRGDASKYFVRPYTGRWFQAPGEVLLRPNTMKDAHVKVGDVFTASIEGHAVELKVVGGWSDSSEYTGRGMLLDWSTFTGLVPSAEPDTYLIKVRNGADIDAVVSAVSGSEPDFLRVNAVDPSVNDTGQFVAIFQIPALLLLFLAAVSVFNTMLLTSRERTFDIATLKALGMDGKQVMAMVVAPAMVLGLIALVLGLPFGIWLLDFFVRSVNEGLGQVTTGSAGAAFGPMSVLVIVAGGLATAVLGALTPAIWAARAPVVTVLRAE
jgi:putative ABC transport system permease protein